MAITGIIKNSDISYFETGKKTQRLPQPQEDKIKQAPKTEENEDKKTIKNRHIPSRGITLLDKDPHRTHIGRHIDLYI